MKVVIATCYESNEERVSFVVDACKSRGYDVTVYTTDYSHIKKQLRDNVPTDFKTIKTNPYKKNLSIQRMLSHKKFSKDLFVEIEKENPDLIWLMIPANSLVSEANKYKLEHQDAKLIIDVIDMWPESLPLNINKYMFPLNMWRNIRKKNINCADALVTECDFFHRILLKEYGEKINTIYWARDSKYKPIKSELSSEKLSLCYIGSINNIIDTHEIVRIINSIDKPVTLHVIGDGENRYNFINELSKVCEVIYHGVIRDEKEKGKIFSLCHAGLNIYKDNLYIGLTVKSIDYFEHGLPIINNIKGDTWSLIKKYNVGININKNTNVNYEDIIMMRKNNECIFKLFNNNFSKEIFIKKCLIIIDGVMK